MPITLAIPDPSRLDWHRHAVPLRTHTPPRRPAEPQAPCDAEFVGLQSAYRAHGGIARAEAVAACLSAAGAGGYVDLARRIVAGQVFSFRWHDGFWLPLFQFEPDTHSLREAPRRVLDELRDVYDGWALTRWHVRPHAALQGQRPLDLLSTDLPAVLAAARSDGRAAAQLVT